MGAGIAASGLKRHGARLDIMELDFRVAEAALTHFGLKLDAKDGLFIGDALLALQSNVSLQDFQGRVRNLASGKYDFVLHDLFTGGSMPAELFSKECFLAVKSSVLRPLTGVLVVNFYGFVSGTLTKIIFGRLSGAFAHVRAFRDEHKSDSANIVFFASDSPLIFDKPKLRDAHGSEMCYQFFVDFSSWELNIRRSDVDVDETPFLNEISQEHWSGIRHVFPSSFWRLF